MRILWISQWFPPDLGALPARLTEMARVWVAEGHEVTVVAAFPHHPLGAIPSEYRGKWVTEESYDGIRVVRCRLWALPNRRMWQRTLCQLSFAVTSVLLGLARVKNADVVIVSSPPFFTIPPARFFARRRRAAFVLEVRDLYPAVFLASGVLSKGFLYRQLERIELDAYEAARHVVVVTRSFQEDLVRRGVPPKKIAFVPNGADLEMFRPTTFSPDLRHELGGEGRFLATFVGTHGLATGLEQILDAAQELREDPGFAFAFVGEGAQKSWLIEEARRRRLDNVVFHAAVAKSRMPEIYAASDACIVCLKPLPLFEMFVPSKIFEVLACGRPLIAALAGEAAQLVKEADGEVVLPGDGSAIAASVRKLRESPERAAGMGRAGREYVFRNFDRRNLALDYLSVLKKVVSEISTIR